jgi:CheY-like chemotaxis protein
LLAIQDRSVARPRAEGGIRSPRESQARGTHISGFHGAKEDSGRGVVRNFPWWLTALEVGLISIVDDDESIRAATKTLLRSVGYEVGTFSSADDLLNSGALEKTRCLILDVRMPGVDGLELQRRLQRDGIHVPIIFITGHDDGPLRRRALDAGAIDLLHKPFEATALLARVSIALGGHGSPGRKT